MTSAREIYDRALSEALDERADRRKIAGELLIAAELGLADAHYAIATWYLNGIGVDKDVDKGVEHLEAAALENHPSALFDLAVCFENGQRKPINLKAAFELYMRAALWGDVGSYIAVGRCFYYGVGIEQSARLAEVWFERSKELGGTYEEEPEP